MNKQYEQVRQFHQACGEIMSEVPRKLDRGITSNLWLHAQLYNLTKECKEMSVDGYGGMMVKRLSWMLEELTEFVKADTVEDQADALIDLMYFAIGTFTLMGIKPEALFDIVHNANMGKVGPDGKVLRNDQGKIVKPDGWKEKYWPEPLILEEIQLQRTGA